MNATETLHRIMGCPKDQWENVQAIQHEPFIWIQYNGSRWAGEDPDDLSGLTAMLESHPLDRRLEPYGNFIETDPCKGIQNPKWSCTKEGQGQPKWIDGPRLYACDGVTSFSGNFYTYSHAFSVVTNHQPTITQLTELIRANQQREDYLSQDEPKQ